MGEEERQDKVKARSQAIQTALDTIGKFVIEKKVGENKKIFGSVSAADVVDVIRLQTGQELDKKDIELPKIDSLGTYDGSVTLHPGFVGTFKVVVIKDTNS